MHAYIHTYISTRPPPTCAPTHLTLPLTDLPTYLPTADRGNSGTARIPEDLGGGEEGSQDLGHKGHHQHPAAQGR